MTDRVYVRVALMVILALGVAVQASAVIVTYDDRVLFEAAAGAVVKEGLEDEALGLPADPLAGSGLSVGLASGLVQVYIGDAASFGFTNTTPGGSHYLAFGDSGDTGDYAASFTGSPMTAFGFDLSGFQPVATGSSGFTASIFLGGGLVDSVVVADGVDFGVDFRGFVSTLPFDSITFSFGQFPSNTADFVAFDEITFNSAAVPEPSTLLLLGAGLAALGLRARRS